METLNPGNQKKGMSKQAKGHTAHPEPRQAWVLASFAVVSGARGKAWAVSNSPMHRSAKFKRRRTSRLDLVKVDRRGAANHKRAQGVTTDSTSAWRAYRSAHTTLGRWYLEVYRGRTRGQSKKRSPEEEL